jgi:hypothetical protein
MRERMNSFFPAAPRGDLVVLLALALARLALHTLTNGQYGFHRDELAVLDDARFLAWGYVAYPPFTPAVARLALELFGSSLVGLRFFSALAQSTAMVLTGLMARELGASRPAQVVAALAAAIAPMALIMGAMFQYIAFDYLWWVLAAYLLIRLLKSGDGRWWLGIGLVIGLGMLTRYTALVFALGLAAGVLLTPARRHLRGPWLWAGVAVALLVWLPNLIWQLQNDFVGLAFTASLRARDVEFGRADGFLSQQLIASANPFTLPLWLAGLWFYFRSAAGRPFRALGWMFVVPLLLFALLRGRFYYLAPGYPMLLAAGAVAGEAWLRARSRAARRAGWSLAGAALAAGAILGGALMLPLAPPGSAWFNTAAEVHDNFAEQIGWPELAATVAGIYHALPAEEPARAGILAGNYGEAGAINLYGPALGLPPAISGVNSYWARGYGDPAPETVIVLGIGRERLAGLFRACDRAGQVANPYGILNEETRFHPDIFVCRGLRQPWPEFWATFRYFA